MKKVGGSTQHHPTEKAIINALLKISEIVQKTEASRRSSNVSKHSKKTIGDGDYNQSHDNDQQQVPIPPPMRTLDSYVSGFNQQSLQKPSNCNQASVHRSNDYEDQERSCKRHYCDDSSTSSDYHRKKSSSYKSFQSNRNPQPINHDFEKAENQRIFKSQTTSYQIDSAATTIPDDQSSSLIVMPVTSAPTIPVEQKQVSSASNTVTNPKTDFDLFIDQQLHATLEKHLRNHSLPSVTTNHENIQQQRKTRLATLTKSETGKLIDELDFTKPVCNSEHYEKQRELAMIAAKQGNYSLSYSIYTNLLHDRQYDYKLKSEILASRATTLLLDNKCFESIDDCTQAIAFNQWNKLAYVVRAACWMIKQEYCKAVEDYSKLFHFFDQSQHVLDLLNLAYDKLKSTNGDIDDEQSIKIEQEKEDINPTQSLSLASPTASFTQPAVYLCYPYQAYPTGYENQQPSYMITHASEKPFPNHPEISSSIHSNNNAVDSMLPIQSNLIWIKNPSRSY